MEEVKQERDFEQEVRALYEEHPQLRGEDLPEDVIKAAVEGKNLSEAYEAHEQAKQEKTKEEHMARSPVKGVTGGGSVDTKPEDVFLRGFSSVW